MKKLAEFGIVCGGLVPVNGVEQFVVGPPFVADELVDEGEHERNVADNPVSRVDTRASRKFLRV